MTTRDFLPTLFLALFCATPGAAAEGASNAGSVSLPLADYLELVEQAETLERLVGREVEKPVADLAAQKTSIAIDGAVAEIVTTFRVELSGTPTAPVALPFSGIAEEVAIEPRRGAGLDLHEGRAVLYAPLPGSYEVTVRGRRSLDGDGGADRLPIAASPAPVASYEVELPAETAWSCDGAVVVSEEPRGERRLVRLALERGEEHVLETRRRVLGREEDRVLARTSVVTVAEVRDLDRPLQRQDVVFYEVLRGELATFELTLPPDLEVDRVATDEGDALPLVDGRTLTVERRRRLTGTGHLVVTFRAQAAGADALPLAPLEPRNEPRERYLVAASAVAADVRPLPAESWRRVDLEDLPERLRGQVWALRPNALWRLADGAAEARLAAAPLPAAGRLAGVVWERSTTTFLTVDGALVHSDRFEVETAGTAFEVALPPGAALWSARVDDVAVRPLERGAKIVVPLAFRSQGTAVVELVAVGERSIERGRSELHVVAAEVAEPVVRHEWRLLLPEGNRYRYSAGDLEPVVEYGEAGVAIDRIQGYAKRTAALPASAPAPVPGLSGVVTDGEGVALPGVLVSVKGSVDRYQVTDAEGHFRFLNLPGGKYIVVAELEGFSTVEYPEVTVADGRATQLEISLSMALEETITVTSESPLLDARAIEKRRRESERQQLQAAFARELEKIPEAFVGGVKPLEVEIPETGKLLVLSGALPPPRVAVELDVKAR